MASSVPRAPGPLAPSGTDLSLPAATAETLLDGAGISGDTPEPILECPNCHALNGPGSLVCVACGARIAQLRELLPRLRQRQEARAAGHRDRLAEDARAISVDATAGGWRRLRWQLLAAVIAAAALGALLWAGTATYTGHALQRRDRLTAAFQSADACLVRAQYACARDGFIALLAEEHAYPGAHERLLDARYGLARQYADAGQWQPAIAESDALLRVAPDDPWALRLTRSVYDRWIQDALGRGDLLGAMRARLSRNACFPTAED